jgi:hypothetical protein
MVLLGRRAQRVIVNITATADDLRHELLASIPTSDLETCMKVLARIRQRAEKTDKVRVGGSRFVTRRRAEPNGQTKRRHSIPRKRTLRGVTGAANET